MLTAGMRLGPYEVLAPLGAGGMGEVYRARDTRLKREVAIKILPDAFAHDTDRLARFQREAELLATLNHPNIAAVYGLEIADDHTALVLELVEGDTLADVTARGPMAIDDALSVARQIAAALAAAHEKGIIHRDLKPANIKVTPDARVKVLDFGLAKFQESDSPASSLSLSPTLNVEATHAGMIMGTAAYMSPEQARGKTVDRRTDIWAFGCVLYELLTGRRVFDTGETISDAVAAVLRHEPDWTALPNETPSQIRRLLRRCLQKDSEHRLHHITDARLEIEEALNEPAEIASATVPVGRPHRRWWPVLSWTLTALALGVAVWALWSRNGSRSTEVPSVRRLELNLPAGVELFGASSRSLAISPDGSRIAFVGVLGGSRQIYLRALDQFDVVPLRGTDGATATFFSSDGRSLGFVTAAGVLKTVSLVDGATATVIGDVNFLYGSAWSADDWIVFARGGALWEVHRSGGTPKPLTTLGGAQRDTLHAWPTVLPDGQTILFAAASGGQSRIESLQRATGQRRTVVERGTLPLYAATGYLVYFRDGELLAVPFDLARLEVNGPAIRVVEDLPALVQGFPLADLSAAGTLVYSPTAAVSRLVWVSRQGTEQALNDVVRSYASPRLAPDGSRLVVQAGDLWIQDLARATFTRLVSQDAITNGFPTWTSDGRRIMYRSPSGLRMQDADGSGQEELIAGTSEFDFPGSITTDNETIVVLRSSPESSFDIYALSRRDAAKARPIVSTTAYEGGARLSPDSRWLIYVSNESGRNEVYLRPYPGPERRWQVSTEGGTQPVWNPNGKEIFYRTGNKMMVVEVATAPAVTLAPPRLLFEGRFAYGAGITIANYDVARDGQRFVMVKDEANAGRLNVVLNWLSDLTRGVPGTTR